MTCERLPAFRGGALRLGSGELSFALGTSCAGVVVGAAADFHHTNEAEVCEPCGAGLRAHAAR